MTRFNVDDNKRNEPMPPTTTLIGHSGKPPANTFADTTHKIGVIPRSSTVHSVLGNFFFAIFLITLIISIVFLTMAWFAVLQDAGSMTERNLSNTTGVSILGRSLQLDPDTRVLSISWKVLVCANTTSEGPLRDVRVPVQCEPFDEALDVYLNEYIRIPLIVQPPALTSPSIRFLASSPLKPSFSFAPHTKLASKSPATWDPPRFTMQHEFDECGKRDPTEHLMVPFQHYSFNAFVFAIDPTTNQSVPIAMFGVLDTVGDFVIRSHDMADMSTFTYDSGNGLVATEVESRVLRGEITRSAIAKAFAVCLFLVNWTLTVGSVYVTALVASRMLDANSVAAALPFSAPLTIPMVRSLYINSPPLGTSIDAVAFFVQIATVGLCSLVVFGVLTSCQSSLSPPGFPV